MKPIPFRLLAGILIAAIVVAVIAIIGLGFKLLNDDSSHTGLPVWPTATAWIKNEPLPLMQTPTNTKMIANHTPTPTPTLTPIPPLLSTATPFLPTQHPALGTGTPESCTACHQNIHRGGG
jgi:hypothetical protein